MPKHFPSSGSAPDGVPGTAAPLVQFTVFAVPVYASRRGPREGRGAFDPGRVGEEYLVVGANVTDTWSDTLGISKLPLIIALIAMVGISLINYVVSILPTGLEPKPREKSPEGVKAMFYAIEKDNLVYAQKVLSMNFDPNVLSDNGYSPLQYAAMRGNAEMVELFLRHGANVAMLSKEGESAIELALKMGHGPVADTLKKARQEMLAQEEAAKSGKK